jgi:hydrogenase maturation factor
MSSVSEREAKVLGIIETARAKRAKFRDDRITMAHGAGGKATSQLVEGLLQPAFGMALDDAALVGDIAITTDAFVVRPLRFPGGSIGELAVNGTVNDLAMAGARPLALTLGLILEEGLDANVLRDATRGGVASVLNELARAAKVAMLVKEANVPVAPAVTGACELLGIDPMYVANEGVFVAIVAPDVLADGFTDIGEIKTEPPGMVLVETSFGGKRVMDELVGDPLPRIC